MTKMLWRSSVGPLWLPFGHRNYYEWTAQVHDAPMRNKGMTTNPSYIPGGAAGNISLDDVSAFADGGGFWVLRSDSTIEYIAYESLDYTFNIMEGYHFWSDHAEQGGSIPIGSEWQQWFPLQSDNGVLDFTEQLNEGYNISSYRFDVKGIVSNKALLIPHHLIAVEYSLDGVQWNLLTMGVIRKVSLQDDQQHLGAFDIKCSSLMEMTRYDNAKSMRYGEWVINADMQIAADSTLSQLFIESTSGDIKTGMDSVEPSKAADGDEESLWIGGGLVDVPELGAGKNGIIGVYFNSPAGIYTGANFIQCKNMKNSPHSNEVTSNPRFYIYNPTDDWKWIGSNGSGEPFVGWLQDDLSTDGNGIVVDREDEFTRVFPSASWDEIRDLQSRTVDGVYNFFDFFKADGGAFYYRNFDRTFEEGLMWGSVTVWPGTPDGGQNPPPNLPPALPGISQTGYALLWLNGAWGWHDAINPGIPSGGAETSWLKASLPNLDRRTAEDYAAGTTYIETLTPEGVASSSGLPLVGGDVAIGESVCVVSGRDPNGITITPGLQEDVLEGTSIFTYHRGQATWAYPIKTSTWSRNVGDIVPYEFTQGFGNLVEARSPDSSGYTNDYWSNPTTDLNTEQSGSVLHDENDAPDGNVANGVRIASYYFLFRRMYQRSISGQSIDRARMNELGFLVNEAFFSDDEAQGWVIDPEYVQTAIKKILDDTRLGPNGSYEYTFGHLVSDFVTEPGKAYEVVNDLSTIGQALLQSDFDGKVRIMEGRLLSLDYSSPSISRYWDSSTLKAVDVEQPLSLIIDYVTVEYMLEGGATDTAEYPDEAERSGFGDTPEIGPFIVSNENEALLIAANYFNMVRIPYSVNIELAEGEFDSIYIRVGQVHQVTWDWAEEGPLQRNFLILAVNQHIQRGQLVTGISGIEVGRTTV